MKTFSFRPRPMEELRAQAVENGLMDAARSMAEGPARPRPVNVQQVLDLGGLVYFRWRGRSYGVPPLPWKAGAELMDAFLAAQNLGPSISQENTGAYYRALDRMARIMWRNCRPVGTPLRVLKVLRLHRNPFRRASERELADLALFFLGCRMKASRDALNARAAVEALPTPLLNQTT